MGKALVKEKKKINANYIIFCIIGLFLMFGFGRLPLIEPLTRTGMQILGIFVGLILMWSTVGLIWPSILGIIAFGLSEYTTVEGAISAGLGHPIVWQLIMMMIISECIRVSGVGEVIARWLITRKFLNGRPILFTFMFLWVFFITTPFLDTIASIFLSWAIFYNIAEIVGYKKGDKYSTMMIIGCMVSAVMGGGILPFQGWMLALSNTYGEAAGTPINYGTFMAVTIVIGTLILLVYTLSIKYIFKCDLEKLKNFDVNTLGGDAFKLNYKQVCSLLSFVLVIVYVFTVMLLPPEWAFTQFLDKISHAGMFGIIIAVQCMIRIDGEAIIDFAEIAKEGISWNVIFICATAIPIASALTSEATGVRELSNNLLSPILGNLGPVAFIAVVVIATSILTNIGSNIGVALMLIPITIPFVDGLGISPSIIGMAILFIANIGFILPGSSAMAPFLYDNDWVEVKDIYKYGAFVLLCFAVVGIPIYSILGMILPIK